MTYRNIARLVVVVLATAALVACSDHSPAAPSTPGAVSSSVPNAQAAPGTYTLYLIDNSGQIISSLPAGSPGCVLVLWGQVRDSSGAPAQKGTVHFETCARGSGADVSASRPSADCDSGVATWRHYANQNVDGGTCSPVTPDSGNGCIVYGCRSYPITVGFRFKFIGQGAIANGVSASQDMTWVAIP
jgi:hypothetical protein